MGSLGPPQEKDAAPMREKAAGEGRDPSDSPPRVVWTFTVGIWHDILGWKKTKTTINGNWWKTNWSILMFVLFKWVGVKNINWYRQVFESTASISGCFTTPLKHPPSNLYQQAIFRDSFHSWRCRGFAWGVFYRCVVIFLETRWWFKKITQTPGEMIQFDNLKWVGSTTN